MYLLKGIKETEEKLNVQIIFNLDVEENKNIDTTDGVIVEKILEQPKKKRGIGFKLYVNPKTKEQFYEEFERMLTQEEKLDEMNEKLDLLMQSNLESEGIL
ncbi:hypothetical protein CLTEP_02140 [Clostridium tepidiprofundi DSM 19306]|uniref:Uncharacterized protein n=1 Tax=Clostridium tepidiprofundi DSM 19306 TaxID=1121338 RepID=A0A151B7A2_9CLOT|nr:hypothetical protein [Clostridium tepidiprofundi]KYH35821.1 hypothetical protein CLTEP_02140 [Clostridium tepidiprofundi DSM 19306]